MYFKWLIILLPILVFFELSKWTFLFFMLDEIIRIDRHTFGATMRFIEAHLDH